ncbi:phosphoheptose isomerase [Paenibacillus baekrokdamisoli]|uniref:Phosphoheptose isomerase n=1 Tax=Paenibacillus baekrokdamisoli TaxID=1712516 RepID=A0A3G9JG46_9BACL|nr:SIS domain-containing protein [Paenibacillus baekrokdamisoli]MBB3070937.1 D-sedoheptulose 7-phosphate isomerase [Paenibacillus baekrokdamisoli]BBH22124.1 phosphoheptose isomerase [Paenibacillus baekrokdamisoli]
MNPHLQVLQTKYPELQECLPAIQQSFSLLETCYRHNGKVLVAGNGGSAADSEHIVGELMKGFMLTRPVPQSFRHQFAQFFPEEANEVCNGLQGALPAISLVSHSAFMTAYSNDVDSDMVFAQQVYGYGQEGDVFLSLSTSGNSRNIIRALQIAKAKGMKTVGLTGNSGGKMKALCDVTITVPYHQTPDIQERHLPIYHTLCIMLEEVFFGE